MIARFLFCLLAISSLVSPCVHADVWSSITSFFKKPGVNPPPTIRVLLTTDRREIDVGVNGPYILYDPRTGQSISSTRHYGYRSVMKPMVDGISWGEEFPGVHQFLIVPKSSSTTIMVDGREYHGMLYIYEIDDKLSVVNRVPLEDYLTSVLSTRFEMATPEELLSAVAITERTNAYFLADNPRNSYWSINAQEVGYNGIRRTIESDAISQAVRSSRHMVMSKTGTYEGIITPFPAYWKTSTDDSKAKGTVHPSKITITEAEQLAEKGDNAAQILKEAYPGTSIQLIYHAPGNRS